LGFLIVESSATMPPKKFRKMGILLQEVSPRRSSESITTSPAHQEGAYHSLFVYTKLIAFRQKTSTKIPPTKKGTEDPTTEGLPSITERGYP
jgi:hypothetical protein